MPNRTTKEVVIVGRGRSDSRKKTIVLTTNESVVDLSSQHLRALDLSPIADCTQMRALDLSNNWLSNVDLSPIGDCRNLEEIDLSRNNLREIDLQPLAKSRNLRVVNLAENILQMIDLGPLSRCRRLESVFLNRNQLEHIDLSPLSQSECAQLDLTGNELTNLDLAPMSRSKSLRYLHFSQNRLTDIDLWPLAACSNLRELYLGRNQTSRVDATPVIDKASIEYNASRPGSYADHIQLYRSDCSYDHMEWPLYHDLAERNGWSDTLKRIRRTLRLLGPLDQYAAQRGLLAGMGIGHLGGFDGPIADLLKGVSVRQSFEEARAMIREQATCLLTSQIDSGGPTLFIDTSFDRVDIDADEYVLLSKTIVKRLEETTAVTVGVQHGVADLRPLLLTSFGHGVRAALGLRDVEVDIRKLETIRAALTRAGIALRVIDGVSSSALLESVSESLKHYVFSGRSLDRPCIRK